MQEKSNKSTKKYVISEEITTVVRNLSLDGVKALKADSVTTTYEVKRRINSKTGIPFRGFIYRKPINIQVESLSFELTKITPSELAKIRKSEVPSFVLKVNENLYYTRIPENLSFVSSVVLGEHQCASLGHNCKRLSAAADELGGCEKVRDYSTGIERYPWIVSGYETFNTTHDSFVVANCLHFNKQSSPEKNFSKKLLVKH